MHIKPDTDVYCMLQSTNSHIRTYVAIIYKIVIMHKITKYLYLAKLYIEIVPFILCLLYEDKLFVNYVATHHH